MRCPRAATRARRCRFTIRRRAAPRRRWRREHGSERPFFMLLFFDATHHKYYYPPAFERFRPALPEDHNLVTGKVSDPAVRLGFINRYKNAVGYVDHLVAEVGADFTAA